jgi:hypothetical protein
LENCRLQDLSLCLRVLNLAARKEAGLALFPGWFDQEDLTVSRKPLIFGQKFSNLKTLDFGMFVLMTTLQGI